VFFIDLYGIESSDRHFVIAKILSDPPGPYRAKSKITEIKVKIP
jgi:hypothetical protein